MRAQRFVEAQRIISCLHASVCNTTLPRTSPFCSRPHQGFVRLQPMINETYACRFSLTYRGPHLERCCSTSTTAPSTHRDDTLKLILYGKPGCHLCEGLEEKLQALLEQAEFTQTIFSGATLEKRDITTKPEWKEAYGMVIPVLTWVRGLQSEIKVPRPSPRITASRLGKHIQEAVNQAASKE